MTHLMSDVELPHPVSACVLHCTVFLKRLNLRKAIQTCKAVRKTHMATRLNVVAIPVIEITVWKQITDWQKFFIEICFFVDVRNEDICNRTRVQ